MGKKSKGGPNLGRLLIKDRFGRTNQRKVDNDSMLHTTEIKDGYDWGRLNLNSVTEESSFNDFMRTAELAGTEFQAEKLNITFVNPKEGVGLLTITEQEELEQKHVDNRDLLTIPRRPKWTTETTAEELQQAENASFLDWRRGMAKLQEDEDLLLTPYEKNLEFWRQLWRVVERSDVIVQIVDARNPLLFRSLDLEKYVKEVNANKLNMILVNKSDLLTDEQRKYWAAYFDNERIRTAFFSATLAADELHALIEESESEDESRQSQKESRNSIPTEEQILSMKKLQAATDIINRNLDKLEERLSQIECKIETNPSISSGGATGVIRNDSKVLSRLELIEFFKNIYTGHTVSPDVVTIGLVGYPNVGKSSTINALMTKKKVSVSATPGKTKHFQTLYLDSELLLCDCPGLVMPSFMLTKADMILNGILPIDQMRDYVPPVNLLCRRIPRHTLEDKYGIIIAKPIEGEDPNRYPFAEELLLAYAYNRGFMTSRGQPDQSRAARFLCKEYVNGKLLYALAPPTVPQHEFHIFAPRVRKEVAEETLPSQQQRAMRINRATGKDLDSKFFQVNNTGAYVKGRTDFPHIRVNDGSIMVANDPGTIVPVEKHWRTAKKEKREKLRKKFAHLDQV